MSFEGCKSLQDARELYRRLLMEWHPDRWPDGQKEEASEKYKQVQIDFQGYLRTVPFRELHKDVADRHATVHSDAFWEALELAMRLNVDVEVIGSWIHVTNYTGRDVVALTLGGFWYSYGHKAMIWSPDPKRHVAPRYSTDQLRWRWGSEEKRKKRYMG